ncbi:Protein tyrosine kinase [Microbacterium sp. cf332]|nr:Protein tyrosine kinase [Microbacterium sp. cf332]
MELPTGLSFERFLAAGERADLHLCRDAAQSRQVVVKVFRRPLADSELEIFPAATSRLIALSAHPSIATVHRAGTSSDGRPYIVLEYCSQPDLAETTARGPASVPEALRLLIRLCGALESAHRAGLAHGRVGIERVLTTPYGWPAMIGFDSDAVLRGRADTATTETRAADVRGLAVAAAELLTGRPIAESAAGSTHEDAIPVALESLILATLDAAVGTGPSAADFGHALQRIEADLHLPITHLDVGDVGDVGNNPDDPDDRTVLSSRSGEDRTVLVDRRDRAAGAEAAAPDETVLVERRGPGPDTAGADQADDESTMLARRSPRSPVEKDHVAADRAAAVPDGRRERYRPRAQRASPEVERLHIEQPVRRHDGPAARRRGPRVAVVAVITAGVVILGTAATVVAMVIGGGV